LWFGSRGAGLGRAGALYGQHGRMAVCDRVQQVDDDPPPEALLRHLWQLGVFLERQACQQGGGKNPLPYHWILGGNAH
jgi:hypothetical protein